MRSLFLFETLLSPKLPTPPHPTPKVPAAGRDPVLGPPGERAADGLRGGGARFGRGRRGGGGRAVLQSLHLREQHGRREGVSSVRHAPDYPPPTITDSLTGIQSAFVPDFD